MEVRQPGMEVEARPKGSTVNNNNFTSNLALPDLLLPQRCLTVGFSGPPTNS